MHGLTVAAQRPAWRGGREALAQIDALGHAPCVVLLDLFMPVMNGWDVLDRLRADGRLSRLKVLITTSAAHNAPAGLPVFQKPLNLTKVLDAVEAAY
jgi:CheY-like chemotaxis protein